MTDWTFLAGKASQYLIEDNPSMKSGKPVLSIFELMICEIDQHFTSAMKPTFFHRLKECAVTYMIVQHRDYCRLLVKINVICRKSPIGFIMHYCCLGAMPLL
jgi:hypothetical protein